MIEYYSEECPHLILIRLEVCLHLSYVCIIVEILSCPLSVGGVKIRLCVHGLIQVKRSCANSFSVEFPLEIVQDQVFLLPMVNSFDVIGRVRIKFQLQEVSWAGEVIVSSHYETQWIVMISIARVLRIVFFGKLSTISGSFVQDYSFSREVENPNELPGRDGCLAMVRE